MNNEVGRVAALHIPKIFKTITEVKKDSDLGGETGHWIRTESPMQIYTYTLKWELMTATKGWEHWLFT